MNTIHFKLVVVLVIFLALSIISTCITISFLNNQRSDGVVINLAGRQRMFTQKISKEAIAFCLGTGSKESLVDTINKFNKTLKVMTSGDAELKLQPTKSTEILSQLNCVQKIWKSFHMNLDVIIASSDEIVDALSYINDNNLKLMDQVNAVVLMLEKRGFNARMINLSGKQRLFTQKMVKEVQGILLGTESSDALRNTSGLFDKILKGIITGDRGLELSVINDDTVLAQLLIIQSFWNVFYENIKVVLQHAPAMNRALAYITENNIKLLEEMNKAVGLYEKEAVGKVTSLKRFHTIALSVTVITSVLTWFLIVYKSISKPIIRLMQVTKKLLLEICPLRKKSNRAMR